MNALSRQAGLFQLNAKALQEAEVVVVGAGGTGSAVVAQLAHVGVGTIHVIDYDVVDESNLNRLIGATQNDVENRTPKVEILARSFGHLPQTTIVTHQTMLDGSRPEEPFRSASVLIGCVDTHRGRHFLNQAAQDDALPLFDIGCKVQVDARGAIYQLASDIRRVEPGGPCLYCYGAITAEGLEWEGLSSEERRERIDAGYATAPGVEPAIVMMTMYGAAIVASQVVARIVGHDTYWPRRVIVDAWGHTRITPQVTLCASCRGGEENP